MPSLHNQISHNQYFSQLDKPASNTERQNYNNAIAELTQKNYQQRRMHNSTSIENSSRLASNEKNIAMSNDRNFVQRGDLHGPIFELDHLATFSISSKQGQLKAEDGMRKLRIMEKSAQGIWTMDCQILIDSNYLVIFDRKNGREIEKFPLSLVHDPTSVVSEDKKDVYNNIVLFTVLEDSRKKNSSAPSEMHIFQCNKSHSAEIVDEIYKAIEANPQESKYQTRDSNNNYTKSLKMASNIGMNSGPMSPLTRRATFNTQPDFLAPTRIEMEVQVLNHCFDDIELFVTKLQNSVESHRELEKRQKNRKSHKKHAGDGILSIRAQMPSQDEYVDIFQKFKHSFNLLAKLRAHIHDPNAPELVHFLFTPLSLIISTIKEQPYRGLSKTVWVPLLTKDANDLLLNCLSSKEQDLWLLLGEAWTVTLEEARSRPQQYGHLENEVYTPVFANGWQPTFTDPYDNNRNEFSKLAFATAAQVQAQTSGRQPVPIQKQRLIYSNTQPHSDEQQKFSNQNFYEPSSGPSSARNPNIRNYEAMKKWAVDLCYRGAKIYEVTHDRPANNEKELTIKVGELLEVLDDKRNWWRLRNFQGEVGHAPVTILRQFEFKNNFSASNNHMGHYDAEKNRYGLANYKMLSSPISQPSPEPCSTTSSSISLEKNLDKSYNDSSVMSPNNSSSYLLSKTYNIKERSQEYDSNEYEASFNRDPRQNTSNEEPYHNILPSRIYDASGQSNESPLKLINTVSVNQTNSNSFGYSSNTSSENNNYSSRHHEPMATTPKASYMNQNPPPPVLTFQDQIKQNPKQFLRKTESVSKKNIQKPIQTVSIEQNKGSIQDEIQQRIYKKNSTKEPMLKKTSSTSIKRPELFINEKSTQEEVKSFLESKDFSNEVIQMFSELTGEQIFMLEKEDFEKYCGNQEGTHLDSQIKVQKSLCGFIEQPTNELDKILQKRKQMSENTQL